MKTNEELNALRNEVETLNKKLAELTEDELKQVAGGMVFNDCPYSGCGVFSKCNLPQKNPTELCCCKCDAFNNGPAMQGQLIQGSPNGWFKP